MAESHLHKLGARQGIMHPCNTLAFHLMMVVGHDFKLLALIPKNLSHHVKVKLEVMFLTIVHSMIVEHGHLGRDPHLYHPINVHKRTLTGTHGHARNGDQSL